MIQEAAHGSTFEIIGQNDEGTWLVTELSSGVIGWIPSTDIQLNIPELVFELIETPVPPPSFITVTIVNNMANIPLTVQFLPSGTTIRTPAGQSTVTNIPPGQYQINVYGAGSMRPDTFYCQTNVYISTNIYIGGNSKSSICASLP
jgi:hypothetical protein